jgi:predicted nucleic acid-binding protein
VGVTIAEEKEMTAVVCDASVLLKLIVAEEDSNQAETLASSFTLIAPEIIFAEVGNVLCTHMRNGRLDLRSGLALFEKLNSSNLEWHPIRPFVSRAIGIAHALRHAVYDCLYLALAEHLNAPLVTADQRFISAVRRSRLQIAEVRPLSYFA